MNNFPKLLLNIADDIKAAGGKSYIVGGVVRDFCLGLKENIRDYDVEVYGLDEEVLFSILKKYGKPNLIGKAFGVLHLARQNIHYDFSFPRTESKTGIGHRAFEVKTDPNLTFEQAAKRRDFTINAMGMELPNLKIIDPYNGQEDLKNKILRHVSSAFAEDSLRVLRGVQFAARFELRAAKETIELCRTLSLNDLSRERIEEEFRKWLLKGVKPSYGLDFYREVGLEKMFPEIHIYPEMGATLDRLEKNEVLMFSGLLYKSQPLEFLKKWIPVNNLLKKVPATIAAVEMLNYDVPRCALKAGGLKLPAMLANREAEFKENKYWEKAPEPFITGQMLLDMGHKPSKKFGEIIRQIFEMQLDGEVETVEEAKEMAGRMYCVRHAEGGVAGAGAQCIVPLHGSEANPAARRPEGTRP